MIRALARGRARWLVPASLVVVVALVAVLTRPPRIAEDKSLLQVKEAGELVVGIDPSFPPFEDLDERGQVRGYDVDLASFIAGWLGVSPSFVSIDVGSAHDALVAKKFDVIISSLPPFPELSRSVSFSQPYFNAGQVLVINQDTNDVASLEDLQDRTVAVEGASAGDLAVRQLAGVNLNLTVHSYPSPEAALGSVRAKGADAGVVDVLSALDFIRLEGGVKIVGEPLTVEPYVITTRREDKALLQEIDRALSMLAHDGLDAQLQRKWLGGG